MNIADASLSINSHGDISDRYSKVMGRREKLQELIQTRFGGSQAEFARSVHRQPALIWQYLRGHRKIGEQFARHVEQSLRLPEFWFDEITAETGAEQNKNIPARAGLARVGEPLTVSLSEYLDSLRQRVHEAPESIRHDASHLIMKYLESEDDESSARLLQAIEALLNEGGDADVDGG